MDFHRKMSQIGKFDFESALRHYRPMSVQNAGFLGSLNSGGVSGSLLKAYWQLNEASGTLVNNAGSVTNNSTLGTAADSSSTANLTYAQTGKIGNAISFNGTTNSSSVIIGSSLSQFNFLHNTTALWSINLWYKKTAIDTNFRTIIANHYAGVQAGIRIAFNGSLGINIRNQNASGNVIVSDTTTAFLPNDTNWNMLTVTYDQSLGSNNLAVYSNGTFDHNITKIDTGSSGDSSMALRFGDDGGGNGNMYGLLDEIAIWNRVLTTTEITALYNGGNGLALF